MQTDYQELKDKGEKLIQTAMERLESLDGEINGLIINPEVRAMLERFLNTDSIVLREYLARLERERYPVGSNFERDVPTYKSDEQYRFWINGVERHVWRLTRFPQSYLKDCS